MVCRMVIWYKANLSSAQYLVFTEEMYESAVNDNAEDFPKVAVDAYPMVVFVFEFVSTFVDRSDQTLVPNIGEELRIMLKSLSIVNWNLCSVYVTDRLKSVLIN